MISSSRIYSFALAQAVLHQSTQLVFLNVSAGEVLGQVKLAIGISFGVKSLPELCHHGVEGVHWLNAVGQTFLFNSLNKQGYRMGAGVDWVLIRLIR